MAYEWLIKANRSALVLNYFMGSVRMVETPESDLVPMMKMNSPISPRSCAARLRSNKLLPRRAATGARHYK